MRGYYAARARPTLKARLAELAALPPSERHSLADEIDMARLLCDRSVRVFEAACIESGDEKVDARTKADAIATLKESLGFVGELVTKAAKVRQVSLETVDVEQLHYMVNQMVIILEEELEPGGQLERVVNRLREIKLPSRDHSSMTPKEIARMFKAAAATIDDATETEVWDTRVDHHLKEEEEKRREEHLDKRIEAGEFDDEEK